MKRLLLPLLALAALALPARAAIDLAAIKPNGFARGVVFTVNGYAANEDRATLTNFPVLVRISSTKISGFAYTDSLVANGGDLRFKAADGTPLPFEVDTWNTSGESLVWVKLPSMTNGTEFAMFYGASASAAGAVAAGNPWGDYTGVWHLKESGSGESARLADSTANGLTAAGASGSSSVAQGKIGGSWRTGNDRDKVVALVVDSSTAPNVGTAITSLGSTFTASFWANPKASDISWGTYIGTKETEAGAGWGLQWNDSYKDLRVFGGTTRTTTAATDNDDKNGRIDPTSNFAALRTQNTWHKIDLVFKTGVVDNKTVGMFDVYLDGVLASAGRLRGDKVVSQDVGKLGIGGASAGGSLRRFNGEMDEVRLRAFVPTADWAKADFDTVDNENFLSASAASEFVVRPAPVVDAEVVDTGAAFLQLTGTITALGGTATGVDVYAKAWPTAAPPADPDADWTLLAENVGLNGTFGGILTGLEPKTAYTWAVKGVNNLSTPETSDLVTDTLVTSGVGDAGESGGVSERQLDEFVHTFMVTERGVSEFEFTPPEGVTKVEALVVAGGGPGGYYAGGGGGAGGLIHTTNLTVTPLATYTITVGKGGVASDAINAYGSNGGNSTVVGTGVNLEAVGGGAGGNGPLGNQTATGAGQNGGSGGGAGGLYTNVGGNGTMDQGNNGGSFADPAVDNKVKDWNNHGPGGGGAGGAGQTLGGNAQVKGGGGGGGGIAVKISGDSVYYAGGGGGGGVKHSVNVNNSTLYGTGGAGGSGGGGKGGQETDTTDAAIAENGVDGLGGGGGGGSAVSGKEKGGNGGNGVVIIRYGAGGDGDGVVHPTISLTGLTYDDVSGDATVTYRVGWAGDGYDRADVIAIWGYYEDDLDNTNALVSAVIGQGEQSFTLPRVSKTVYVRLLAKNSGNYTGISPEVKSLLLVNPAAPVATVSASQTLGSGNAGVSKAALEATVTDLGAGASSVNGVFQICADKFFDEGTYTTFVATNGPIAAAGTLKGGATGLLADTTYWVRAVLTNDVLTGGEPTVYETEPVSFRTGAPGWPQGAIQPSDANPAFTLAATSISAAFRFEDLGEGTATGTVQLEVSTTADFAVIVATSETAEVAFADIPALLDLSVEGLQPETAYYVRYRLANSGGRETVSDAFGPITTRSATEDGNVMILIW